MTLIEETKEKFKKLFDNPLNFQMENKRKINDKITF